MNNTKSARKWLNTPRLSAPLPEKKRCLCPKHTAGARLNNPSSKQKNILCVRAIEFEFEISTHTHAGISTMFIDNNTSIIATPNNNFSMQNYYCF